MNQILTNGSDNGIEEHGVLNLVTSILGICVAVDKVPTVYQMMFQILVHQLLEAQQAVIVNKESVDNLYVVAQLAEEVVVLRRTACRRSRCTSSLGL